MQLEKNGRWKRGKHFEKKQDYKFFKKKSFSWSDLKDWLFCNNFVILYLLKVKGDACFTLWIMIRVSSGPVRFRQSLLFQTSPVSATEETSASCWVHFKTTKALLASMQMTQPWVRLCQVSHLEEVKSVCVGDCVHCLHRLRAFVCVYFGCD